MEEVKRLIYSASEEHQGKATEDMHTRDALVEDHVLLTRGVRFQGMLALGSDRPRCSLILIFERVARSKREMH